MGAEGAVNIIFRKQIEAAEDPEKATRKEMVDNFKAIIDPYIAAGNDMVDDIIDPRETRPTDRPRAWRWRRPSASSGRGRSTG